MRAYPGESSAVCNAVREVIRGHHAEGRNAFGLFMADGSHYVLVLRNAEAMGRVQDHSEAWRRLDVSIIHRLILEEQMGITAERLQTQANLEYIHDFPHAIREAHRRVRSGQAQALFLLNPTRIGDIQTVARNGERMPQKSTFFYPKVYTGLVFYGMDDGGA